MSEACRASLRYGGSSTTYDEPPGEEGQLRYLFEQITARRADLEQPRRDIRATLDDLAEVQRRWLTDLARLDGNQADPAPRR